MIKGLGRIETVISLEDTNRKAKENVFDEDIVRLLDKVQDYKGIKISNNPDLTPFSHKFEVNGSKIHVKVYTKKTKQEYWFRFTNSEVRNFQKIVLLRLNNSDPTKIFIKAFELAPDPDERLNSLWNDFDQMNTFTDTQDSPKMQITTINVIENTSNKYFDISLTQKKDTPVDLSDSTTYNFTKV